MTISLADWLDDATITYTNYAAGDLERISGLRTDMQRVWRRRGQFPALKSGHARFTISETIEITLRYAMSKIGVPPSELSLDLSGASSAALFHAIFAHGGCEVIGPAHKVDHFLEFFREDNGQLGLILAGDPKASNYLVLNEWHEARIVDDPGDLVSDAEELSIVFNLVLMGSRLVERGRKPIVTVQFRDWPGERTVRRLTGLGANDS